MTTVALLAAGFVVGFIIGGGMGVWIAVEHEHAPLLEEPTQLKNIDMEYIDGISGEKLYSSTTLWFQQCPDGRCIQHVIQNN